MAFPTSFQIKSLDFSFILFNKIAEKEGNMVSYLTNTILNIYYSITQAAYLHL